eukprot:2213975-Prorocentrum_lima.AAC.1
MGSCPFPVLVLLRTPGLGLHRPRAVTPGGRPRRGGWQGRGLPPNLLAAGHCQDAPSHSSGVALSWAALLGDAP